MRYEWLAGVVARAKERGVGLREVVLTPEDYGAFGMRAEAELGLEVREGAPEELPEGSVVVCTPVVIHHGNEVEVMSDASNRAERVAPVKCSPGPFTEADFVEPGDEVISEARERYHVDDGAHRRTPDGQLYMVLDEVDSCWSGGRTAVPLEEVSEHDRQFVKRGAQVEDVTRVINRRGHGRMRVSYWLVVQTAEED
jgi:hypothetical protein